MSLILILSVLVICGIIVPIMEQKQAVGPKEFFLHVGALITLIASVVSIITVLFTVVEIIVPDTLNNFGYYSGDFSGTRFALATLIIVFPAYYFIARYIRNEKQLYPEIAGAWVRKWLTGLIVFATGTVVLGDVISLLYRFVDGELTSQFALKSFAVLVVVMPFLYYFFEAKNNIPQSKKIISVIAWIAPVLVLGSIVLGFAYTGLPGTARDMRLDTQKINDLQSIQWRIINYYQNKGSVPESLVVIVDDLNGDINFKDKETGESYKYTKTGDESFELCATFHRVVDRGTGYQPSDMNDVWVHGAGEHCFKRSINSDLYPVIKAQAVK